MNRETSDDRVGLAESADSAPARAVRSALVHQLYTTGSIGPIGALLGAAVLTVALWDFFPHLYLGLWIAGYVIVNALRRLLLNRYLAYGHKSDTPEVWEKRFAVGNFIAGIFWGFAGVFFFPANSIPHQYMLGLFIAGISCGAVAFYWPSSIATFPTILVELLPISCRFFFKADDTGIVTGVVVLYFVAVLFTMARYLQSFGTESVRLRFEKEDMLASLQQARDGLEVRVKERTDDLAHVNDELRREIDERIRAQEHLVTSEEKYREVVDNVQESIFVAQDGSLKFVNPATTELLGYSESELLSTAFTDFIHPDDRELVYRNHIKRINGDQLPERYSFRIMHKNGEIRWVEITNVLIQWDSRPAVLVFMMDVTDRRMSEDRYRQITENSVTGIFIHQDGVLAYANQRLAEMLGYTREEMIGQESVKAVHPADLEAILMRIQDRLQGVPSLAAYELRLLKKTGETIRCEILATRIDYRGRPAIMGNLLDITERKKTENALKESEAKYRELVQNANSIILRWNREGIVTFLNEFGRNFFGYSPEEIVGRHVVGTIVPKTETGGRDLRTLMEQICADPTSFEHNVNENMLKDGRRVWVEWTNKVRFDERSQVAEIFSVGSDITGRKEADEALRESERRFRLLLDDVASVPVQGYDADRKVVLWNTASERLYGYSRDEALGRRVEDLIIPPYMQDEVIAGVNNWLTTGERIPAGEVRLMRKDGVLIPVYSSHVMLESMRGEKELYCVDLDLTDLKKAEEERSALKDQLREAQKLEAIGTLAGGIAHDFNNILQVALGYSELLLQEKSPEDADFADIQKINQSAASGAELVRGLLAFSRKAEPRLAAIDLNEYVVKVHKLLGRTLPMMIEVRLELAGDIARINADPAQIEQILMNLAVNARDAMGETGILTIRTENVTLDEEYCLRNLEAQPGEYVMTSVVDTGCGMGEETLLHIFEPFYTTKELGRGTGLGLAIVYGIVKHHGGHIDCCSEPGKGATFKLFFPAIASIENSAVDQTGIMPAFGTETVLLVDDEEFVRELGERILRKGCYTVITASGSADALEIYHKEKDRIALVILDLVMPGMGGKDCLKRILALNPQTKALIASGYSADVSMKECLELGARGFVAKPFRFKELLQQVRMVLDQT